MWKIRFGLEILGEKPIDEHNHALGALRYMISRVDSRFIAKLRKIAPQEERIESDDVMPEAIKERTKETAAAVHGARIAREQFNNPDWWTTLN